MDKKSRNLVLQRRLTTLKGENSSQKMADYKIQQGQTDTRLKNCELKVKEVLYASIWTRTKHS